MKAYEVKCPECGAALDVSDGRKQIFCSYCGTKILLDDGVERKEITNRYVNEAEITKAQASVELERMRLEHRQKENARMDKVRSRILIGCAIGFILLFLYVYFAGL